jgi:hypothetical protein
LTFIGIDHGTTAIRFALIEEGRVLTFELERARAADMSENEILTYIEDKFELKRERSQEYRRSWEKDRGRYKSF